jgi:hypothetical protein
MPYKVIGMLGFHTVNPEGASGEVLQIESNDDIGSAFYSGGNDMPIIGVGQCDHIDKWFKVPDEAVFDTGIHKGTEICPFCRVDVGTVGTSRSNPFVMDQTCPSRSKQFSRR